MDKKTIMILGAGEVQVPIIKECKKLNHTVILVDYNENAPGFKYADIKLVISTMDSVEILNAAKKYKIDGILTTSDAPVRVVGKVCDELGLAGLNEKSANVATNKFLLRECLHNHGISVPQYWKVFTDSELDAICNLISYPLIIKPVDSSASRGVSKAENQRQLTAAFHEAKKFSASGEVIVEEFLVGPEYSIEGFSRNGEVFIIAITEKTTVGANQSYFVESRHIIPASLSFDEEQKIKQMVIKSVNAIGLNNCAIHAELKLTKNGPIIIEIGARLGGDNIASDLVPLATGINMLENVINISLGSDIKVKPTKSSYSGIQFIDSSNYHEVERHLKKVEKNKGFIKSEVKTFKNLELHNSLDRLGYFICNCDSKNELLELLNY